MKRTKVINLISGPGVGKSVCAGLIFSELKIRNYSAEYAQEYVKQLIWKGDFETIKNQYYVSSKQYELLKNINGKVDYIVTDGSLIHGLYYNRTFKDNVSDIERTEVRIKELISEFENVYIFLERGLYPFEEVGRIHTYEESLKINKELEELLIDMKIKYLKITSSKMNIDKMIEYIIK